MPEPDAPGARPQPRRAERAPRVTHQPPSSVWRLSAVLLLVLLVTACGSNSDSQRRFASDVGPSAALPTMPPTPTPTSNQANPYASSPVPVAQILAPNGGPDRLFFQAGRAVWTIKADGSGARRIFAPVGHDLVKALATSHDAARVAILVATGKTGKDWSVLVLDASGHQQARIDGVAAVFGEPLPASAAATLNWAPRDDQLLLAVTGGGIAAIPLRGKPTVLVSARQAPAPGDATWAPGGNAIAFLDPIVGKTPANLYVARTGAVPLDPASIINGPGQRPIVQFAWTNAGHELLYIQARGEAGPTQQGGDIFSITAAGQHAKLVVSGGSAGPVAEIVNMAVSPDGKSIAYTVFQPSGNGLSFLSLWVQRLGTTSRVRLPVPTGQTVTDLWWTKAGLVWRTAQIDNGSAVYGGGVFALYQADSEGNGVRLLRFSQADLGTPAASPIATPNATPVGSPQASPAATPAATPKS